MQDTVVWLGDLKGTFRVDHLDVPPHLPPAHLDRGRLADLLERPQQVKAHPRVTAAMATDFIESCVEQPGKAGADGHDTQPSVHVPAVWLPQTAAGGFGQGSGQPIHTPPGGEGVVDTG